MNSFIHSFTDRNLGFTDPLTRRRLLNCAPSPHIQKQCTTMRPSCGSWLHPDLGSEEGRQASRQASDSSTA